MKRKQGLAALVAGAVIVVALLAVFAVELSDNQAKSRKSLETQAHQRAQLVAGLLDTVFQSSSQPAPALLATYGRPRVSDSALQRNRGDSLFLALLAPDGRVLAHSSGFTAQAAATIAAPGAVSAVQHGQRWYLGDSSPYGSTGVIDFATWLHTSAGRRILLTGFRPSSISGFVTAELAKIPGAQGHHSLAVDGDKTVIASTNPLRPPGYRFHTKAQLTALSTHAGVFRSKAGTRYFDQVRLGHTSWKIILSLPASEFFASVSGVRHYLPWVIFAAFGLVALGALLLVRRAIVSSERIRLTNDALTQSNGELNVAHSRLEEAVDELAVANDALERSNAELERQAQELVRSNTELDQFASIASHDLQEPLRKVRTFTERISTTEAENLSERGVDYLRRANASAERMQILIEDLLRFSRVSSQGQPFAPVDLARITEDVLDDLSEQVNRAGARIEVGPLPTLSADGPQMRQLMQNLISNALKFSREGVEPVVRIESTVEFGWATITVADNGIGFDPQYSRRIFRVFERLHGRGAYAGTGIGLALCRKIAERHGGTVIADATPGEGATFTVTMQTQRTEAVSEGPAQRRDSRESATRDGATLPPPEPVRRPFTILLADDDEEDRELARDALQDARLANEMQFAVDGEDLMDYLGHTGRWTPETSPRPGIILLDLNMPKKDGREALQEIKADESLRRIPVVVLTTSRDEADVLATYNLGVSSFITKPVTFGGLVDVMRTWTQYWFEIVELPNGEVHDRR